ncbi:MAG: ABC transporter permease [Armatimonadota bacterium]
MNRRVKAIIRKEFTHILRDPRSLGVAVILPIVMLLLYGYGINTDVKHLRTAVLDMDNTRQSRELLDAFSQSGYFDFTRQMNSYSELERLLDASKVTLAIYVPKGFASDLTRGSAELQIVTDGSDASSASLAMGYASQISRSYSQETAVREAQRRGLSAQSLAGLDVKTRYWYNPELNSTNFIVPGLIAVILMLLSALLTSMTIVRERERGTIEQLVVSPIMPVELIIGKILPYSLIALLDIVLVILGGRFIFGVPLAGSPPLLLFASCLFLVAALGIGLLISCISKSQLTAMAIAVMATMLPTILLSGFVFPISGMPKVIQTITYVIPARYYLVIVRGIFLKGVGLDYLWPQMLFLLVSGVILVGMSVRKFRKVL